MGKKVRARLLYERCNCQLADALAAFRSQPTDSNLKQFSLARHQMRKAMFIYARYDAQCPVLSGGLSQ